MISKTEYNTKKPFDPSLMVFFRKHFGLKNLSQINETICKMQKKDDDQPPAKGSGETTTPEEEPESKGQILIDASCVPADICYPTDLGPLNDARQKTEAFIDLFYEPLKGKIAEPRTYRGNARKKYLPLPR
jgi:transposase, IS5 family